MKKRFFWRTACMVLSWALLWGVQAFADDPPPQLQPKRLASIGDSITVAVDAEVYGANHWASYANGYSGFWQWLFGLTNVNSHNQRISAQFGRFGRKNYLEAESGADSFDLPAQASQAVAHGATYVPWLMGHNDICQGYGTDPTDLEDFQDNVVAALAVLKDGLPEGATVYVVGMVDVTRLYDIAMDKKALGIVDCEVVWLLSLLEVYPCANILGPLTSPADREILGDVIAAYNTALQSAVTTIQNEDDKHYYFYTDDVFQYLYSEYQVSDLDCFHPSAVGQAELSAITWGSWAGPRFDDGLRP